MYLFGTLEVLCSVVGVNNPKRGRVHFFVAVNDYLLHVFGLWTRYNQRLSIHILRL